MNYSLFTEPFDIWGFDGKTHISDVDYGTKWVEVVPTKSTDHKTSIRMHKDVVIPRFVVPIYLMIDGVHTLFMRI